MGNAIPSLIGCGPPLHASSDMEEEEDNTISRDMSSIEEDTDADFNVVTTFKDDRTCCGIPCGRYVSDKETLLYLTKCKATGKLPCQKCAAYLAVLFAALFAAMRTATELPLPVVRARQAKRSDFPLFACVRV